MKYVKEIRIPMDPSTKLDQDESSKIVDSKVYLTTSRLDIMFNICLCQYFQSSPKKFHMNFVKYILRYLIGTIDLRL